MEIDIDVPKEILRYNSSLVTRALVKKYKSESFFEIISKDSDELIHSRALRWIFLLSDLPCEWKTYPIMNFLDIILERALEQNITIDNYLKEIVLLRNTRITVKNVSLEIPTSGVKIQYKGKAESGRSDLVLECEIESMEGTRKLTICIENKIDTNEHNYQTWKYYGYFAGPSAIEEAENKKELNDVIFEENNSVYIKEKGEIQLFVFLTPHSNIEMEELKGKKICSCPYFIHINYQDCMDHVLQNIVNLENLDNRTKTFIKEYMYSLSIPHINNNRKHQIMAMTPEDSKLLSAFWKENEKMFLASLDAFVNDNNQDAEERDQAEIVLKAYNKSKVTFKVTIDGNQSIFTKMTITAKFVVEELLRRNNSVVTLNNKFSGVIKDFIIDANSYNQKTNNPGYDEDKKKQEERRYVCLNNGYYLNTQWKFNGPKSTFQKFMNKANEFEGINVEAV